ncbi:MAG: glycosyltransferase, partial [Actinomycetota bacterium]
SFAAALALPVAAAADYVLLLHGDTVLDGDSVANLVEATTLQGAERVGVVGAKVVDLERPRKLRDVGRSVDRFGHAMSPLQADEIDQGQFDRVLEVLAVDGCAMLIAREVWQKLGLYDERLGVDDVDLCWRARVAGWQVLMTPRARVQHGPPHGDGDEPLERSERAEQDRVGVTRVLKNYAWVTLLWVIPLGILLTLVRLVYLALGRRFEEAFELLRAVGWNFTHITGTIRRRRSVQRARAIRDHALRHFTASAGLHIPRWFQTAERILEEQRELGESEADRPVSQRLRHRTASFVSIHPVIVGCAVAAIVGAFAIRALLAPSVLVGGVIPVFPSSANGFFQALVSGFRATGLGGSAAASPGLAALGGISYATLASTALAQKAIVIAGPVVAAVLAYRATVRRTGRPGPSVVAASAYSLSALMLWSVSEGRIALLFVLAVLPALVERVDVAFAGGEPADGRWRSAVGLAVTIAVGVAFIPGVILAVGLVAVFALALAPGKVRGLILVLGAVVGAAILLFPFVPTIASGGLWSGVGQLDPWKVLRLSMGHAPGDWSPALFLPVAALLGLALASGERRGPAARSALVAITALALAWLSVAGYLPAWASNAPVYAGLAAVCEVFLIGDGLASALGGMERASFGFRQIGSVVLSGVLILGLSLQVLAAMVGGWSIGGPEMVPAAWSVLAASTGGSYNVVWLGAVDGQPFSAPGGDPTGVIDQGDATVTFGLTDRQGALAIDTGRPLTGAGDPMLRSTLSEILSGTTVHGGALLAPFGVRFVIAPQDRLPTATEQALQSQVDLELVPSAGLSIWRNIAAIPPASVLQADRQTAAVVASGDPRVIQGFAPVPAAPLDPTQSGWTGASDGGDHPVVATAFDGAWELDGTGAQPQQAFGWATSFSEAPSIVTIRYADQLGRTIATWLLAVVWGAALWITRKPVRR